jgi:hypothetical protein
MTLNSCVWGGNGRDCRSRHYRSSFAMTRASWRWIDEGRRTDHISGCGKDFVRIGISPRLYRAGRAPLNDRCVRNDVRQSINTNDSQITQTCSPAPGRRSGYTLRCRWNHSSDSRTWWFQRRFCTVYNRPAIAGSTGFHYPLCS